MPAHRPRSMPRPQQYRATSTQPFTLERFHVGPVRRRRWPKRTLIGVGALLGVLVLLVGGIIIYARWRYDQIPKARVGFLTPRAGGQPFNVLLVGSDSRAFVDTPGEAGEFGSASSQGGQRSDVIIVAHVVPQDHEVRLLSIPRDTYVDIPGQVTNISGPNRINTAFNSGPTLLVETIENSFHIPLSDYAEVNFPGFSSMVNALGGIKLDFADPVHDSYSGLNITRTGCQLVNGPQALALVRSRHLLYYSRAAGGWETDYGSDWSRIQRQDAFFRALLPKLRGVATSPTGLNSLLGAATKSVTIDNTLSESALLGLAQDLRGMHGSALSTETLPTIPYTTAGGADVLLPAAGPDDAMIHSFLAFGATTTAEVTSPPTAAVLTAAVDPTVTTIAPAPTGTGVVYNTSPEPWNPVPC